MSINSKLPLLSGLSLVALLLFSQCTGSGNNTISSDNTNTTTTLPTTVTTTSNKVNAAVRPPIKGLDIPSSRHIINGSKGGKIELPSGTVITFAPNIFVDKDGKAINEDVEISYREMHDAAEILISGIPIFRPETGEYMETAGMFEINGSYKNEEVFIAKGKNINVNMASFNEGTHFDFWQMNPTSGAWTDIDGKPEGQPAVPGQPNTARNQEIIRLTQQQVAKPVQPTNPKKVTNPVFDLEVNYSAMPELAPFKGIIWECIGNNVKENPDKNAWVFDTEWKTITIKRNAKEEGYRLDLKSMDKSFTSLVRPILSEKDYAKAIAEFDKKLDQYKDIGEKAEKALETARKQAAMFREFQVSGFGIYNWDCMNQPGVKEAAPQLSFTAAESVSKESVALFLITKGSKAIFPLAINQGKDKAGLSTYFKYNPAAGYKVVAIIDGERMVVLSESEFDKLKNQSNIHSLSFGKAAIKATDLDQVKKILNS
jgi:hypothetical protein